MTHAEIVKKVEWKDLKNLSIHEMLIENNLTIPWVLTSWLLAYNGYYILALPFSAFLSYGFKAGTQWFPQLIRNQ